MKYELLEAGKRLDRGAVSGSGGAATVAGILQRLRERGRLDQVDAVCHRVVHGGTRFTQPVLLDDEVIAELRQLTELAPLHNGPAVEAIVAAREALGRDVPAVASFDTAFHSGMPPKASTYAIPMELAERHGIKRFGFHGLAHRYMAERAAEVLSREEPRLVTLQLGAGCSAAAVAGGRSLDTTMGFTPLEGLVMATRSGDVDPALSAFLVAHEGLDVNAVHKLLDERSGLLGVSGRSPDMRELLEAEQQGDGRARLAVELFCYRVRKAVGAYLAVLEGADAVIFGGGIGEHSPVVRRRICMGMDWCGLALDEECNQQTIGNEGRIDAGGPIQAWVLPVDEAQVMAREAEACLAAK